MPPPPKGFPPETFLRTYIMGILNVTPDSFSGDGLHRDPGAALARAVQMVRDGADIIDVGGLSTRPGSEPVPLEEEISRTVPVIRALSREIGVPVSIDTYRAEVARGALGAGASIVNDISGLRFDPEMPSAAAAAGAAVVVMHIKGTPGDMQQNPVYEALIPEILDCLRESIRIAEDAGIKDVIIDPGIGFGKTFDHNLEIINNLREFTLLGRPVLVGPSRKAFLGSILGDAPPSERMEGTAAAVAACIINGASIVRVHDVREMAMVAKVADAIKRESVSRPKAL
jgi:dihydropteroate synthase